jgi:hypothetical protein
MAAPHMVAIAADIPVAILVVGAPLRVTAADVQPRAVAVIPLRAADRPTAALLPTVADHRTAVDHHTVAVAADMGGNTTLKSFPA